MNLTGNYRFVAGSSAIDVYGAPGSGAGLQVIRNDDVDSGLVSVQRGIGGLPIDVCDAGGKVIL